VKGRGRELKGETEVEGGREKGGRVVLHYLI
jgi:hypothetical protein